MKTYLFIFLFISSNLLAQQTKEWVNLLENPEFPMSEELKPENKLPEYSHFNLEQALAPKSDILGYIGSDYRRIKVDIKSISKSDKIANLYFIEGNTNVSNNTCDFEGTIIIEQFREFMHMDYGVDSMYADAGHKAQGIAIGKYLFAENPKQKHVGTFQGIITLWWYVDKDGSLHYSDLGKHYSDRFKNNQYVGTWTEYGKTESKTCNWGEYRIPFSDDLDWGAAHFSVNPKYYKMGWQDFKIK